MSSMIVNCGMSPPDVAHIYTLHVYALDVRLGSDRGFNMNDMFRQMEGHILAQTELSGWYDMAD